jgi:hypothetical protein
MAAVAWKNIQGLVVNDIKLEHVSGKGFPNMEDILKDWLKFKGKFYEWANNITGPRYLETRQYWVQGEQ